MAEKTNNSMERQVEVGRQGGEDVEAKSGVHLEDFHDAAEAGHTATDQ